MRLENQVCTVEQARRLQELGINNALSALKWECKSAGHYQVAPRGGRAEEEAAFTAAELGIMLPYGWLNHDIPYSDSEATLRAYSLIRAIEVAAIAAEEVNQRLAAS